MTPREALANLEEDLDSNGNCQRCTESLTVLRALVERDERYQHAVDRMTGKVGGSKP